MYGIPVRICDSEWFSTTTTSSLVTPVVALLPTAAVLRAVVPAVVGVCPEARSAVPTKAQRTRARTSDTDRRMGITVTRT